MIYLLDANILINAKDNYYEFDRVPQYWEWIGYHAENGRVKIPYEINEEITLTEKEESLKSWWRRNRENLILDEEVDQREVQHILEEEYGTDLSEDELRTIGADPALVAYAIKDIENRTVVTAEVSASSKSRKNRRIPDVCMAFGVRYCNAFAFGRSLDFRIDWDSR